MRGIGGCGISDFGLDAQGVDSRPCWRSRLRSKLIRLDKISIQNPKSEIQNRKGLTLLEVILALAILGLSLAAITQLISLGARAARESRDLTKAQLIAESVLAELSAEVIPVENMEGIAVPREPDWVYSTLIEGTDEPGLIAVHVVVEHVAPADGLPLRFIVTRWFVDPELIAEEEEELLEPTGADL